MPWGYLSFPCQYQCSRTVEHRGGLDAFLLKANTNELSAKPAAQELGAKKLEEKAAA
jgi:hypothetical protein